MNATGPPPKMDLRAVLADIEGTSGDLRRLLESDVAPTPADWLKLGEFCFSALALCWEQGLKAQRRQS